MQRSFFIPNALEVAPRLIGCLLSLEAAGGSVTVRITEVEAYHGLGVPGVYDAGSHSKDRKTDRNASMFGPPGHAYVYLNYGMHFAINMVCSPEGIASGVLIRSGEVVSGERLAQSRRSAKRGSHAQHPIPHHQLARGPGNLAAAMGITRQLHDGLDLLAAPFSLARGTPPAHIESGPRVGVSGIAGSAAFPWRFWAPGERSVSAYRPGRTER